MYIPYEKIGQILNKALKNEKIKNFFCNLKVEQNVNYVAQNKPIVLNKLKNKLERGEKLIVVFHVYDETKWKCQYLYNLFDNDSKFTPQILVSKTAASNPDNPSYQGINDVKKTYAYFKEKGLNVEYAYDTVNENFIPFEKFSPDIIFYQHPWYVERTQGPVVCSKFALTSYIPYFFSIEPINIDCGLRFHKYIESYYVLDEYTKKRYEEIAGLKNLRIVGNPYLDYFKQNQPVEKEYVIYAPHWTFGGKGVALGTFEWSGNFMLEYAKTHPEIKWIFKPHPLLFKALTDNNLMTKEEAENYYNEWGKIGIKYESGDYLGLFEKSKMMITDCSSFLGEYFMTQNPLIHLMSQSPQFNNSENPILKTFYRAYNLDELKSLLETLPKNDTMHDLRAEIFEKSGLKENCASQKIVDDILNQIYSV